MNLNFSDGLLDSTACVWGRGGGLRAERSRSARADSEVNLFRDGKSVIDLNAEIPDGALNLGVAEQ